ncbi:MAG: SLBB domain-containing protein [Bacteroidetes bacterium]|nr:SLBB domain-containing protein [Bacteroidota bacterium]
MIITNNAWAMPPARAKNFSPLLLPLLFLLLCLPGVAWAQLDELSPMSQRKDRGGDASALLSRDAIPVARTVDAQHYYCGAGDVFSLVLTLPVSIETVLPVSADGSLVIPRLGAVQVAGLSLADAREKVFAALREKYTRVDGTLSLIQPRTILVRVQGEVRSPGLLQVTAATPVSMALHLADQAGKETTQTKLGPVQAETPAPPMGYRQRVAQRWFGTQEMETRALRRIIVQHADGSVSRADLSMYEGTRDAQYDPLLREGDVLVVPHRDAGNPTIAVLGAVRRPGVFEFIPGDRVSDLVRMGFGLDADRTVLSAELIRTDGQTTDIDLASLRQESNNTALRAGDRLFVYADATRSSNSGAAVADGELQDPGIYPIVAGQTTLAELVTMAGGFSKHAWPGHSELYRRQTGIDGFALDEARDRERNFEKSPLHYEDTLYFNTSERLREGRVAVDFHRLFILGDRMADVTLEDGDILLVPRNSGTVYVYGQVNNGGFIAWSEGKNYEWYIAQAGGYGASASEGRAAVIKASTREWADPATAVIEPGDMIFVPHTPLVRLASTSDILAVTAAIVGSLTGLAGLLVALLR